VDVDCDHVAAGDLRVLNRKMPQPADAEDRGQVARASSGDFDGFVGRDTGARERRSVDRRDSFRHLDDVVLMGLDELGEAAVDRVSGVLLLEAERLPSGDAVVADSARIAQPRNCDAVAHRNFANARAELFHDADALVARDERWHGLHGPVAMSGVDVRMAQAGCLDPDEDLILARRGLRDLLDSERLVEGLDDRGLHESGRRGLGQELALTGCHRNLLSCR
jgi:hypothetical protein